MELLYLLIEFVLRLPPVRLVLILLQLIIDNIGTVLIIVGVFVGFLIFINNKGEKQ